MNSVRGRQIPPVPANFGGDKKHRKAFPPVFVPMRPIR